MELVMAIGNDVLEKLIVDPEDLKDDVYQHLLKTELIKKHSLAIAVHQQEPRFYLQAPSEMDH